MTRLLGVLAALALLLAAPAASARGARGAWSWNSAGTARGGQWQGFSPSWSPSSVIWLRADSGVTAVAGPVTATGTTPPTVTLAGTPTAAQTSAATPYVELDCTTLGILGTSEYTLKLNGATVATNVASASSGVSIPGSGLTAGWAAGTSAVNDVYTANVVTSTWADQSGAGHNVTQGTAANQPIVAANASFGGCPAITGNGTSDSMAATYTLVQPSEVFIVAAWATTTGVQTLFDGATNNSGQVYVNGSSVVVYRAGSGSSWTGTPTAVHAYDFCFDLSASFAYQDGILKASGGSNLTTTIGGITLLQSGGGFATASIAEVFEGASLIDPSNRARLVTYAGNRYGIAVTP